jgi:hypothetical protein
LKLRWVLILSRSQYPNITASRPWPRSKFAPTALRAYGAQQARRH